ncbi:hypothetical protein OsJ_10183 [Oryza sativa Japonica Group]|uniref:Uncharacterized protein n=1 Tax=Oryza sativa subsp. japonica TaxID=39947 RepID=B9F6U8_ORYSJ|nr:hypothetical protein OsJ_10183 [Oryza sativa Japonica Group]
MSAQYHHPCLLQCYLHQNHKSHPLQGHRCLWNIPCQNHRLRTQYMHLKSRNRLPSPIQVTAKLESIKSQCSITSNGT